MFAFMWGVWVDKNIYTEMCRKKKIILPGYDFVNLLIEKHIYKGV